MHILIVGAGIAGMSAACELLKNPSNKITILYKSKEIKESNSWMAQGGIIWKGQNDSPELLANDILLAGDYKNNKSAVELLAQKGPPLVEEILMKKIHTPFDNSLGLEGAHTVPRISKHADHTGASIMDSFIAFLKKYPQITWKSECVAIDCILKNRECVGVSVLENGEIKNIFAEYTIIATGGLGQVYSVTSNPIEATGDGIAMAQRAGVVLKNMEYIQFHPTALAAVGNPKVLISESVRGHGAILKTKAGIPFMEFYNPKWKDLAPRDEVSRAIYSELKKTNDSHVFLDIHTILPEEEIPTLFPFIYKKCKEHGIDISKENIPVIPAAHYSCGGVQCDDFGQTNISHLFCIGEASCTGVHGANRLASTSLLEGLLWGTRAGEKILSNSSFHFENIDLEEVVYKKEEIPFDKKQELHQLRRDIQFLMWENVGIVRNQENLVKALNSLEMILEKIKTIYDTFAVSQEAIEARNIAQIAFAIASSSLKNTKSSGCHFLEEN